MSVGAYTPAQLDVATMSLFADARSISDRCCIDGISLAHPSRPPEVLRRSTLDPEGQRCCRTAAFRRLNRLAQSFNAMLDGLKAFSGGHEVPRYRFVLMRLVKEGRVWRTEERSLSCLPTSSVHAHVRRCPPGRGVVVNQHLLASFRYHRAGQSISLSVMPSWLSGRRRAGVEVPAAAACLAATAIQRTDRVG